MVTASTEARRALYGQMQQIVYEEVPAILPAGRNNVLIKRRSVVGLRNHPQHWSITWDDVFRTA
jgi:ABC-type transport system substrate-binding protein